MNRTSPPSHRTFSGKPAGKRHRRIRARSTPGQVAGAATNNAGLAAHQSLAACPTTLSQEQPQVPGTTASPTPRTGPTPQFHPRTTRSPTSRTARCASCSPNARSATSPPKPYRPRTNGKVERFHQTMGREWAYGRSYPSSKHRASLLGDWLEKYNHRRPHQPSTTGHPSAAFTTSEGTTAKAGSLPVQKMIEVTRIEDGSA
ncbi:integrase core domain-containing protein [Svornostia abyssi]|uniref:integrase core domain-containing protein n=1 Tax=Svornostia abyssi TaxID=2898438 RepID=UPI0038642E15